MRASRPGACALLVMAGAAIIAAPAAQDTPGAELPEGYAGSEICAACHDEVVAAFSGSPHAVAPGWDPATGCESCHGPGNAHMESGGDPELIVRPQTLPPEERSGVCLDCHVRTETHASFRRSQHHLGAVACTDCHAAHSTGAHLLPVEGRELCAGCHRAISAQFDLARAHPVEQCTDCHEPHATDSLRTERTLFSDTCADCHFDKAGPFLYDHDVVMVDGCASCHEVHGSPNRHLLQHENQVNLCYQCHSGMDTPVWHSARRFLDEKCTACHTAIHGSNTDPLFLEE